MATLYSLSSALPPQIDFDNLLTDVKKLVEFLDGPDNSLTQAIEAAKQAIDSAKDVLEQQSWDNRIDAVFTAVDDALKAARAIDEEAYNKAISSGTYKSYTKLKEQWEVWSADIGQQKKTIDESIDYTKNLDKNDLLNSYPEADLALGLKVNAGTSFKLAVLSAKQSEEATSLKLPSETVLVNQEVKAFFDVNAKASGSYQAITLAAKASAKGEIELDSFYQTKETEKTYAVLYRMYKQPLLPWSLKNMAEVIQTPTVNGNAEGYRGFSLKRDMELGLSGEIGVGRSFSTISDVKNKPVDISVSAAATLIRTFSVRGKVEIFISKNDIGQLVVNVKTLDSESNGKSIGADVGAGIKGLDQIARPQIEKLLGEGNKFVQLIADNSTPGQNLLESLLKRVDEDLWAKPLLEVLLGEKDTDAAVNELLGSEIETAFNKTIFSTTRSAKSLAESVFQKLLDTFAVKGEDVENNALLSAAKARVVTTLEAEIQTIQTKATDAVKELEEAITGEAKAQLAPLAKLGEGIGEAIDKFDGNATALYEKIAAAYKRFSEKLQAVLDKSADLQVKLQYLSSNSVTDTSEESFSIVLKNPALPSAAKMLRSIVLGDDSTTSSLLASLSALGEIEYRTTSVRLNKLIETKVNLGINVIGFDTAAKKDVVSDLDIKLDASGKVSLVHKYKVSASASGFNEKRNALFNLSYGVAEVALNKGINGAISFGYTNEDSKLHSVNEMDNFLNSLTLEGLSEAIQRRQFAPIISRKECNAAKQKYRNYTNSNGTSTVKYRSGNAESEIAITMRTGEDTFARLMSVNANTFFNEAMFTLLNSDKSRYRNGNFRDYAPRVLRVLQGLQTVNPSFTNLAKLYDALNEDGKVDDYELRKALKNLDDYDEQFDDFDGRDWDKVTFRLSLHFKKANALRSLVTELKAINDTVAALPDALTKDDAIALMNSLNKSNANIENYLDTWIDVTGVFQDLMNDLFGAFGIKVGGLNATLLSFLMLLQNAMQETDLYLVRIQLQRTDTEDRNVIMVS